MKKIAAATLAATMTLSLGAVQANAATNEMRGTGDDRVCVLTLDGQKNKIEVAPAKVDEKVKDILPDNTNGLVRTSADLGQAFGSSDQELINGANNLEAIDACKKGVDYKTADMTAGKKAAIIGSTVLAVILAIAGLASPFVGPMIQQFLPR
ncbi:MULTISPECIES: hypothetical protein [Corynebacterium]|uniref:Secreted protein n=1 Tax=Corynebacterium coyleae TaxID=53374 RepID=A0ABX8KXE4_9CORY|nr:MULTISPECIES: hypothetical protein [Corynebacterium]MDK8664514.1 hypothetical protein [Corynebacterium coyleae]MDK8707591.1 hypothetical protein [Corynebacterium coyleae]MDK8734439.1 hypothetical protein [Corynebacterium coyleae]MDK8823464.1 hypothetical protein [Corynebacterium coyleae]MDK8893664.1 hypothetical protein [Corynebacterium coyleae]